MIIEKVKQYIHTNHLVERGDKIIVGVSGGADSVALLDILISLGYHCIVAHCNFHLRGDESNRDTLFVKGLCQTYDITSEFIDFDTNAFAKDKGISIEMAARELRYVWFEQLRTQYAANSIAVAHHADDSVETVLLNLIRGTGIRGLTGITPKNGYIVRPLLCLDRNEIEVYLSRKKLLFVTDSTNNEDIYTRNKIRLSVLPLLESINPSVKSAIARTSAHLLQVEHIYIDYIEKAKVEVLNGDKIDINKLLVCKEPQAILFEILKDYNFNSDVVVDISNALDGISGKLFYSKTHRVITNRGYLLIDPIDNGNDSLVYQIEEECTTLSYPIELQIETIQKDDNFKIKPDRNVVYIDKTKLCFPLIIRKWKQGDWFIPFGMKGRKKVSDYFSDQKFSIIDKENTWLLCSGNDIVWVIGHRSDDRFKVKQTTTDILKVELS